MYKIYCLNNISPEGLALLTDNYEVTENIDEADAILVRSADMHEMEVPANLKAVARAGAGVNNIPLDKFAEAGIAVFNTPGADVYKRQVPTHVRHLLCFFCRIRSRIKR